MTTFKVQCQICGHKWDSLRIYSVDGPRCHSCDDVCTIDELKLFANHDNGEEYDLSDRITRLDIFNRFAGQ